MEWLKSAPNIDPHKQAQIIIPKIWVNIVNPLKNFTKKKLTSKKKNGWIIFLGSLKYHH